MAVSNSFIKCDNNNQLNLSNNISCHCEYHCISTQNAQFADGKLQSHIHNNLQGKRLPLSHKLRNMNQICCGCLFVCLFLNGGKYSQ